MSDKLKDLFFFGLGSAMLAREVAADFVDEMIRAGRAQNEERNKLIEDLQSKAKSSAEQVEDFVRTRVKELAQEMHLVTKEELNSLKQEVQDLKTELASLKKT